jgi:hypothetical protein
VHPLVEYFRCPDSFADLLATAEPLPSEPGYFRLGDTIAYGRQAVGAPSAIPNGALTDVSRGVSSSNGQVLLPFDLAEVLDNLRCERYPEARRAVEELSATSLVRSLYYFVRPALGIGVRRHLQRLNWRGWQQLPFPQWPVDTTVETLMKRVAGLLLQRSGLRELPFVWFWPDGAPACVMMTHDIEGRTGTSSCAELMELDEHFGIRSAFQVVPDAPWASRSETARLVVQLLGGGFEVNVHDLSHDGHLFRERSSFLERAAEINARGRKFGSRGFRSGAMYRRQEWFGDLDFAYDMSVPNVAHLEPQRGGCCTVMPFFVGRVLELPLTAAQDYTVFHILGEHSTALWQRQIDTILEHNGLASFIAHPDYLRTPRARRVYIELLQMLAELRDRRGAWNASPSEIDAWCRNRREMRLVPDGASWRIEGPGAERARLAWVRLAGDDVAFEIEPERRAA